MIYNSLRIASIILTGLYDVYLIRFIIIVHWQNCDLDRAESVVTARGLGHCVLGWVTTSRDACLFLTPRPIVNKHREGKLKSTLFLCD